MVLFLILLGIILVLIGYSVWKSGTTDSSGSYSEPYETEEIREKNRKAVRAWLAKHSVDGTLHHPTNYNRNRSRFASPRQQHFDTWMGEQEEIDPDYQFDDEFEAEEHRSKF